MSDTQALLGRLRQGGDYALPLETLWSSCSPNCSETLARVLNPLPIPVMGSDSGN